MSGIKIDLSRAIKTAEMFKQVDELAEKNERQMALDLLTAARKAFEKLSPLEKAHCQSMIEKQRGLV